MKREEVQAYRISGYEIWNEVRAQLTSD